MERKRRRIAVWRVGAPESNVRESDWRDRVSKAWRLLRSQQGRPGVPAPPTAA